MTEHIKITACSLSFTYNLICLMVDAVSKVIDFLRDLLLWFVHTNRSKLSLSADSNFFCFQVGCDLEECMSKSSLCPSHRHT